MPIYESQYGQGLMPAASAIDMLGRAIGYRMSPKYKFDQLLEMSLMNKMTPFHNLIDPKAYDYHVQVPKWLRDYYGKPIFHPELEGSAISTTEYNNMIAQGFSHDQIMKAMEDQYYKVTGRERPPGRATAGNMPEMDSRYKSPYDELVTVPQDYAGLDFSFGRRQAPGGGMFPGIAQPQLPPQNFLPDWHPTPGLYQDPYPQQYSPFPNLVPDWFPRYHTGGKVKEKDWVRRITDFLGLTREIENNELPIMVQPGETIVPKDVELPVYVLKNIEEKNAKAKKEQKAAAEKAVAGKKISPQIMAIEKGTHLHPSLEVEPAGGWLGVPGEQSFDPNTATYYEGLNKGDLQSLFDFLSGLERPLPARDPGGDVTYWGGRQQPTGPATVGPKYIEDYSQFTPPPDSVIQTTPDVPRKTTPTPSPLPPSPPEEVHNLQDTPPAMRRQMPGYRGSSTFAPIDYDYLSDPNVTDAEKMEYMQRVAAANMVVPHPLGDVFDQYKALVGMPGLRYDTDIKGSQAKSLASKARVDVATEGSQIKGAEIANQLKQSQIELNKAMRDKYNEDIKAMMAAGVSPKDAAALAKYKEDIRQQYLSNIDTYLKQFKDKHTGAYNRASILYGMLAGTVKNPYASYEEFLTSMTKGGRTTSGITKKNITPKVYEEIQQQYAEIEEKINQAALPPGAQQAGSLQDALAFFMLQQQAGAAGK